MIHLLQRVSLRLLLRVSFFSLTALALHLTVPFQSQAAEEVGLPEDVSTVLAELIERIQDENPLEIVDLQPLLHFTDDIAATKDDWDVPGLANATGGYYGYGISAPVDRIVEHLYHPELPPSLFLPSVVRVGEWIDEPTENIPEHWQNLEPGQIALFRGKGLEENTPDVNTGGYYTYQTDRMIVLVNQEGKKYLLSVSKQKDQSSVGRKGVVIGDDRDWNYFYSDEEGLTTGGLGWVNSYMFDSFSVTVLAADPSDPGRSRHAMFKWVRAGWSGMNMVRVHHVRNGCQRFAQSLVRLMESRELPALDALVSMNRRLQALDAQDVLALLQPYIENLRKIGAEDTILSRRSFQRLLDKDNPLEHYSLFAMQSLVMKELLKTSIGAPALLSFEQDDALVSLLR